MRYISIIIACVVLTNCADNTDHTESIKTIDAENSITSEIRLSDIVDTIEYIKLETNESCLIGSITKIVPFGDSLLICDRFTGRSAYIFGRDGRFINKIGARGNGPGEYTELHDVAIDRHGKRIFILDTAGYNLLIYSTDGNFIKSIRLEYPTYLIAYLKDDTIAMYLDYGQQRLSREGLSPHIMLLDINTGENKGFYVWKNSSLKMPSTICSQNALVQMQDGTAMLSTDLCDTIYRVSANGVKAEYYLNMGKKHRKALRRFTEFLEKEEPDASISYNARKEQPFHTILNTGYTLKHTIVAQNKNDEKTILIFDKTNGKTMRTIPVKHGDMVKNDMDIVSPFRTDAFDDNYVYSTMEPELLLMTKLKDEFSTPEYKDLISKCNKDDNPIVVAFRMK